MRFLKSKAAIAATVVLVAHAILALGVNREEHPPRLRDLREFPSDFGDWHFRQEGVIEPEVQDVLKADSTLLRSYGDASGNVANLFIAYFATQRTGGNPHSPKNCLPGSGWLPVETSVISVAVPGRAEPLPVNRYVVTRGADKSIVLYWYQGRGRYVASEYTARIYLVADAIRLNRTDTSLVRVDIRVRDDDEQAASRAAIDFVQRAFPSLDKFLPM